MLYYRTNCEVSKYDRNYTEGHEKNSELHLSSSYFFSPIVQNYTSGIFLSVVCVF